MRSPPVLLVLLIGAPLARTETLRRPSEGPVIDHITSTLELEPTSSTAVSLVQNSYTSRVNGRPEPGPELKVRGRARKASPAKKTSRPTATADGHATNFLPVSTKATADNSHPNPTSTVTGYGAGSQTSAASSGSGGGSFTFGSQCTVSRRTQTGLIAAVAALAVLLAIALIALAMLWRRLSSTRSHDGSYRVSPQGRSAAKLYAPVYVAPLEDGGPALGEKSMV